ncbi:MFS transporter [Martelella limonii]|uniref:MFS transporter n=1 Tax=Martelella limonii TaxID=1647649 RepID=UPI0015812C33|nr:MFS transporter [Martelella limonii]
MNTTIVSAPRRRYMSSPRLATSLLFLMNGFIMGSWAPKIPVFAERLRLSEAALGLMILVFGVGSIMAMPFTGVLIARYGATPVVKAVAVAFIPTLLLLTLAGSVALAVPAIFLFGALMAAMDVSMNGNAVAVETAERRAIMSSCHGFWSLGGLAGASIGGFLIAHVGSLGHTLIVTAIASVLLAVAFPKILADAPEESARREKIRLPRSPLPWLIGIMALFSMIPEGAVLDWSAIYLRDELGGTLISAGFGFAAFQLTMTVMRFAGDHVRDRFGAVMTVRFCAAFSIFGLLCAGLAPNLTVVIIGFAITGIGISNLVPVAFSAAGNLPGLQPGIGLSVTTMLGYSGILAAPSLIGFIAEHIGFAPIFTALSLLHVIVFLMAPLARYAERDHRS